MKSKIKSKPSSGNQNAFNNISHHESPRLNSNQDLPLKVFTFTGVTNVYMRSSASSASLARRDKRTRIRRGTFLIPRSQTAWFRVGSRRTSGVPIALTANARMLFTACGARFLKLLSSTHEKGQGERVNAPAVQVFVQVDGVFACDRFLQRSRSFLI